MRGDAVLSESCVPILKPCREVRSMTSRPPTNVPASVHQRLLNLARQTNRPFNELLQYFTIQRFLFRFSRSAYAEQFVLKGAQMLQAWDAPLARPTMDIDMLGESQIPLRILSRLSARVQQLKSTRTESNSTRRVCEAKSS